MRDGPIRRWVKGCARVAQALDLGLTRLWARRRGEPFFALEGTCRACGACCVEPVVELPALLARLRSWRWALAAWHRCVNGFSLLRVERHGRLLVFTCGHLDPRSRRCDSYASRPLMCRDYPRALLHQVQPEPLPGCGHRFTWRRAADLERALAEQRLPPERLAELRRKLGI